MNLWRLSQPERLTQSPPSFLELHDVIQLAFPHFDHRGAFMNLPAHPARLVVIGLLSLTTVASAVKFSRASIGNIRKADLTGPWQATLIGNTGSGCGLVGMLVTFNLNSPGTATNASITTHLRGPPTSGCTDGSVTTDQTFTVSSLHSNGSGIAGLSCGPNLCMGFPHPGGSGPRSCQPNRRRHSESV